ncbi:MAG: CDP-diacylglycerol--glycerol-3-phosphate 3-phosphatidyltransferase [Elusimicrobia bacterium]|nr:CDP-diacylglycerol--glycerol-3-phosphate 3-phosphatidyltransferase [Elusimicrobiota bacterium]MDE2509876.1 CDP-diacylglycerol--glycerol-3-phosphate 3-phosphatidyltransferase [Elusimicrobiota bacterium]
MNFANRLTMLRVVLAAAVFGALMAQGPRWHAAALAMFLAAVVTDWLDGYYARKMNSVSPFGKIADPIADKILVLGTLLALIHHRALDIPEWAVFLILMRELLIGGMRMLAAAQGKSVAAERSGKIKTVVQCIAVLLMLGIVVLRDHRLAPGWLIASASPLTMLCAALALSSLWSYYRQYRQMLEKSWS